MSLTGCLTGGEQDMLESAPEQLFMISEISRTPD